MPGMEYTISVEEQAAVKAVSSFNKEVKEAEKQLEKTAKTGTQSLSQIEQKATTAGTAFKQSFGSLGGLGNFGTVGKQLEDIASKGTEAVSTLGGLSSGTAVTAAGMGLLAAGAGGAAVALGGFVIAEAEAAGQTADLADRIGSTIAQAQKLRDIAQLTGVGVGVLEGSAAKLNQVLDEGGAIGRKAAETLERLGVSTYKLNGEMRDSGTVLLDALGRISKVENASERLRLAQDLLGKSAAKALAPAIKDYESFEKIVQSLGGTLDEALIKRLDDTGQKVDNLKKAWDNLKASFADQLNPIVVPIIVKLTDILVQARSPQSGNPQRITGGAAENILSNGIAGTDRYGDAIRSYLSFQDQGQTEIKQVQELSRQFKASRANDPDRLRERLTELKQKRDRLDAALSSSSLGTIALFEEKKKEFDDAQREIAQIEVALKKPAKQKEQPANTPVWFRMLKILKDERQQDLRSRFSQLGGTAAIEAGNLDATGEGRARFQQENIKAVEDAARKVQDAQLTAQLESLSKSKDIQIAALETITARTLQEKLTLERKKLEIELEYIKKAEELQLKRTGNDEGDRQLIEAKLDAIRQASADAEQLAKGRADAQRAQIVRAEMQKTYDSIKDGAGRVFDALISNTKNFGDVLKNTLKTALLAPFRELVASGIANLFAPLFGGMRAGGGGGGFGGFGGGPSFGLGTGILSLAGGGGGFGGPFTGGFAGGPGGGGFFGGGAGAAGGGGIKGMGVGFLGMLKNLGNLGFGPKGGDFGGEVAGSFKGVGGWQGGAMLAGGGILAYDGLRRGGLIGLGETTAGGALIGAKFGGPVGAAIGAAVGFAAGFVRLFIKGSIQKAIEKAKAVYGVTISSELARTIVDLGKQMGGLDVAMTSPQVREMVELYAMATGQKIGPGNSVRAVSLVQSNGVLYQQAQSINGQQYSFDSSLPVYGGVSTQPLQVTVQLSNQGTQNFLEGQAVQVVANQRVATQQAIAAPLEWARTVYAG